MDEALFSSKSSEWATPQAFFNELNAEFGFTLDPCCTHENAKCPRHYTKAENGLLQDWSGERVFCNPPYGRECPIWIEKCATEAQKGATVVALLPARTDTIAFHKYIYGKAEVRFIKGRLRFGGGQTSSAFPVYASNIRERRG